MDMVIEGFLKMNISKICNVNDYDVTICSFKKGNADIYV